MLVPTDECVLARKPLSHRRDLALDLLRLVHWKVGLLKVCSFATNAFFAFRLWTILRPPF